MRQAAHISGAIGKFGTVHRDDRIKHGHSAAIAGASLAIGERGTVYRDMASSRQQQRAPVLHAMARCESGSDNVNPISCCGRDGTAFRTQLWAMEVKEEAAARSEGT